MQQTHAMKRDLIAFIMTLGVIVVGIYAIMQSNLKEVNIKDNGELITFTTHHQTVNEVLREAQVRVGNFDEMNVDFEDEVFDGMEIEINRAQQLVINDAGIKSLVMTTESTVNDVLSERNIDLSSNDELSVSKMSFIEEDMEIEITRVEFELEAQYEEIELETEYILTDALLQGEEEIQTEGSPKIVQRMIENTLRNGEQVEATEVESNVVDVGQRKVVLVGTGQPEPEVVETPAAPAPAAPSSSTGAATGSNVVAAESLSTFLASVTAYVANCPGCTGRVACAPHPDVTSSIYFNDSTFGTVRIVAAGRQHPCGTIVQIEGIGTAIVLDRGGAVTGNVLDLLVNQSVTDPWQFGRRSLQAQVLRWGW